LSFPHLWHIMGFVTRLIRRVSLVEQELLTLPEHMSSPPVFSGVLVTQSSFKYALSIIVCPFSVDHCIVCPSSIYGFWLPLWYLQSLLVWHFKICSLTSIPISSDTYIWGFLKKKRLTHISTFSFGEIYFKICIFISQN
jgi:hypothetical protein